MVFAQLTGVKFVPGDYAIIILAVAAVNTAGVGPGGVTFNVAANYTETITAVISLTATGTSANPLIFRKDPATSGRQPIDNSLHRWHSNARKCGTRWCLAAFWQRLHNY